MSERLRSCRGPSQLAHHRDLRISQWRKPQNYIGRPSSEQVKGCSDILSDAMSGRPHRSQQRSITALSLQAILMFLWIRLSFMLNTQALGSLFSLCHGKKLARFYEPQFGRISLNISLSDSVFETTKTSGKRFNFDLPNSFNLWTVADRDLWWFVNFDALKFLTALVLCNHSNKNSDWLILACLMRVHNVREMRVPWLIRTSSFYFHTVIGTSARISQYIL